LGGTRKSRVDHHGPDPCHAPLKEVPVSNEAFLRSELARVIDVMSSRPNGGYVEDWPLKRAHGMSDAEIDERLPDKIELPIALREYYRMLGRHPINATYNWLRPVDQLEVVRGKVVFLDENQGVVMWGIAKKDQLVEDPTIFQAALGFDEIRWYSERNSFTAFMAETWRWTITGEDDG